MGTWCRYPPTRYPNGLSTRSEVLWMTILFGAEVRLMTNKESWLFWRRRNGFFRKVSNPKTPSTWHLDMMRSFQDMREQERLPNGLSSETSKWSSCWMKE